MKFELANLFVLVSRWSLKILLFQLISFNLLAAESLGQPLESQLVSFKAVNVSLTEIFRNLEEHTAFTFSFEYSYIGTKDRVSASFNKSNLRNVLLSLSEDHNLKFKRINDVIYVSKRLKKDSDTPLILEVSPTKKVTGTVIDSESEDPLVGATIRIEESTSGTITDVNGRFTLDVPDEASYLQISYVGFISVKVELDIVENIIISLDPVLSDLDEVVVVGYSSEKPEDFTGAISSVEGSGLENFPVISIGQALQGQTAGVQVTNDGAPGGGVSVRIRGYGTIGNNDPLYVIDGVPTRFGLNQFSNSDIENIQVLKDASATAIYGARAANGVVIINTKKGSNEEFQVNLSIQTGVQNPVNLPTMVNTQQYADMLWQSQINSGISPSNDLFGDGPEPVIPEFIDSDGLIPASIPGTDWFDELFNNAAFQNYNLSVRGGKNGISNYSSVSYTDQEGIMDYTGFERYAIRINTEVASGIAKIGENFSFSSTNTRSVPTNQALGSRMIHAYRINPIVPVYDVNGDFAGPVNGVQGALNPVGINYLDRNDRTIQNRILGNVYVDLEFMAGFSYRTTLGLDYTDENTKDYDPQYQMGITERGETVFFQAEASRFQYTLNNILQFKKVIGKSDFSILLGQEAIKFTSNEVGGTSSNFVTDEIEFVQLSTGNGQSSNFSGGSEWALASFFGRANYQFDGKYLVSASLRRDGSSRFSKSNRYALFPAFSAGWQFSEESFASDLNFLSSGKVRVSYGQSGNQEIGDFPSFSTFSSSAWDTFYPIDGSNDKAAIGFKPTRIGNDDVKWETTTQTNFGLDIGFSNGISLTADYYIKTTEDILIQRPTLAIEGQAEAPFVNLGKMENRGIELNLGYIKSFNDFTIDLNGNFSVNRNKVVTLADDVAQLTGLVNNTFSRDLILTVTEVGHPISQFYGHIVDGIFRTKAEVNNHAAQEGKGLGRIKYRDINDDGVVDQKDRTFIGNPHPGFIYGLTLRASYRNIDLSILLQGVQGNDIYNFTRYYTDFYYDLGNRHTRILDAWSPSNSASEIPALAAVDINNELRPSTYFIEDGSYMRVKNLQVGYTLPFHSTSIDKVYVYAQAQNLLTLTSYEGIDPEVGLVNSTDPNRNLDIGVDRGVYPNYQTFSIGLNIGF